MKFKCKSTGLIYNFEFEVDIQSMLKHPDYESVHETPVEETPAPVKTSKKAKVTPDESSIDGS